LEIDLLILLALDEKESDLLFLLESDRWILLGSDLYVDRWKESEN